MTQTPTPVEPGSPQDPGDPVGPPEPEVVPSSTPDGPQTIPAPEIPEGEPGGEPATSPVGNAETAQGQPSDGSGAE